VKTHTGERPFMCGYPGCGMHFTQRVSKKRHEVLPLVRPRGDGEAGVGQGNLPPPPLVRARVVCGINGCTFASTKKAVEDHQQSSHNLAEMML